MVYRRYPATQHATGRNPANPRALRVLAYRLGCHTKPNSSTRRGHLRWGASTRAPPSFHAHCACYSVPARHPTLHTRVVPRPIRPDLSGRRPICPRVGPYVRPSAHMSDRPFSYVTACFVSLSPHQYREGDRRCGVVGKAGGKRSRRPEAAGLSPKPPTPSLSLSLGMPCTPPSCAPRCTPLAARGTLPRRKELEPDGLLPSQRA